MYFTKEELNLNLVALKWTLIVLFSYFFLTVIGYFIPNSLLSLFFDGFTGITLVDKNLWIMLLFISPGINCLLITFVWLGLGILFFGNYEDYKLVYTEYDYFYFINNFYLRN